mmetsp:Transcript_58815/g.91482  ORF Transcript_58815/g.91482 Transcript_58815/m.91482 type:complete len:84 (+) Transcript_58815:179-430(+)
MCKDEQTNCNYEVAIFLKSITCRKRNDQPHVMVTSLACLHAYQFCIISFSHEQFHVFMLDVQAKLIAFVRRRGAMHSLRVHSS